RGLMKNMVIILATTIGGTFLVFRFSVAFVLNLLRLSKKGHLRLSDVLALTPIMHRMKGNSKSLTLITVLTAVSLAITTLSYISYYSASAKAENEVPANYISVDGREEAFLNELDALGVGYRVENTQFVLGEIEAEAFLSEELAKLMENGRGEVIMIPLSDYKRFYPDLKLADNEVVITSYNSFMSKFMPINVGKETVLFKGDEEIPIRVKAVHEEAVLSWRISANGPVLVVANSLFTAFKQSDVPKQLEQKSFIQTGIYLEDTKRQEEIEKLYKTTGANILDEEEGSKLSSRKAVEEYNLNMFGTTIFTTAFLGLAFLLATGSILYFKQMSEADEELASYTVLRKIGFTEQEILRGVVYKQAFSFGVPLLIGLLHSYFAVKSGWFLFGTELTTPLLVTMGLYIAMYIIFAVLTISYYKKIIKQAL
ncbi:MAG: FtsX-like permease family protein, partial [Lysinibacillus sp.]